MHSTIAFSGGFKYNPTTSTSFSVNRGSLLTLNVSTRWGCNPSSFQILRTVSLLTPARSAIVRVDQCVAPAGLVLVVNSTISATCSAVIAALRPRPGLTLPQSVNPSASNALRQARTVTGLTPWRAATVLLPTPSAASSSTRARTTSRCALVVDRATLSNTSR